MNVVVGDSGFSCDRKQCVGLSVSFQDRYRRYV